MTRPYKKYGSGYFSTIKPIIIAKMIDRVTIKKIASQVNYAELLAVSDKQQAKIAELQDFAIWMTGCGYEFTQHKFFNEQRDKLILDKPPKEQDE